MASCGVVLLFCHVHSIPPASALLLGVDVVRVNMDWFFANTGHAIVVNLFATEDTSEGGLKQSRHSAAGCEVLGVDASKQGMTTVNLSFFVSCHKSSVLMLVHSCDGSLLPLLMYSISIPCIGRIGVA